jgi:hypothetical protein
LAVQGISDRHRRRSVGADAGHRQYRGVSMLIGAKGASLLLGSGGQRG